MGFELFYHRTARRLKKILMWLTSSERFSSTFLIRTCGIAFRLLCSQLTADSPLRDREQNQWPITLVFPVMCHFTHAVLIYQGNLFSTPHCSTSSQKRDFFNKISNVLQRTRGVSLKKRPRSGYKGRWRHWKLRENLHNRELVAGLVLCKLHWPCRMTLKHGVK